MTHIATIRHALERLRRIAWQRRYGGLAGDYRLAQEALAALDRVEQPPLWEAAR